MRHDDVSNLVRTVLGANIRTLREETGQDQTAFAEMACIDRAYYNRIEQGMSNITVDMLVKVADGLDVPIVDLFKGMESEPPRSLPKSTRYAVVKINSTKPRRKKR